MTSYAVVATGQVIMQAADMAARSEGLCRGHNGKVKSLAWSPDDAMLVSSGADGAVYQWKLKNFKRAKENVLKVLSDAP